jgi:hypothetical protein
LIRAKLYDEFGKIFYKYSNIQLIEKDILPKIIAPDQNK